MTRELRARGGVSLLCIVLCLMLLASLGTGAMAVSLVDALLVLFDRAGLIASDLPAHIGHIIESIRLPRTLLGILVGGSLGVAGAAIQGLFRNPLADPGLIGVSGGAALAAVSVIVLGGTALAGITSMLGSFALPLAAFLGGLASTLLVAKIATGRFGTSVNTMLLAGIAVNIITAAGIGILTYLADDAMLRTLTFWTMGSLGGITWSKLIAAGSMMLLALVLIPRYAKAMNALLLGESEARHLGIDVDRVKTRVILLSAMAVGAAVSVSGIISFVGLLVPHLVRMTIGPDHRYLLPASGLLGAVLLLLADIGSRTLVAPAELPIGLITSVIGGPCFIALIIYRNRRMGV